MASSVFLAGSQTFTDITADDIVASQVDVDADRGATNTNTPLVDVAATFTPANIAFLQEGVLKVTGTLTPTADNTNNGSLQSFVPKADGFLAFNWYNLVAEFPSTYATVATGKTLTYAYAIDTSVYLEGAGNVTNAYGVQGNVQYQGSGTLTNAYGVAGVFINGGGGTLTNGYAFYAPDLVGAATNPYFLWYNGTGTSAGVFRVNHLGILAYYNPAFAAYTPGAANYERIVMQWNTNVAEIGTEAGGTGTLRAVKVIGASLQAASYKSDDGTAGATAGPFTVITGITVKNGLVTALTGS